MRVLMLNYEYPPLGGGAASATYHTAKDLARLGWEVVVLTSGAPNLPEIEHCDGVELHRVRSFRHCIHDAGVLGAASYLFFARLRLQRLLKEREFDLAHFYFALPTGMLSAYWRARTGKPYIVSLRGSDVPNYDNNSRLLRMLHRLLLRTNARILRNAHAVVANSEALRALALESFPEQRIDVITNGVCLSEFRPPIRREPRSTVSAICVARLIKRKGAEDAMRAMKLMKNQSLRLDLVGLGPRESKMRALADELGIADRVVFRGHLKGEDLARAYQEADIFLLPSLSESFSMALLEGMASGLPVVATKVGGIPELVEDGANGFLVPCGDPERLAAALDRLVESRELRARLGSNNRHKIEQAYDWPVIVGRYVDEFYTLERSTSCDTG
ncbi:MAG TPA: glycosyltransferase family 4 protein [Gammaproteobacteria bacterium]|jgi:glycosyltransferase involved in cell wall biosynthesis